MGVILHKFQLYSCTATKQNLRLRSVTIPSYVSRCHLTEILQSRSTRNDIAYPDKDISCSTNISNIFSRKHTNSFKLVQHHASAIASLRQKIFYREIFMPRQENFLFQALRFYERSNTPKIDSTEQFANNDKFSYFKPDLILFKWRGLFVYKAGNHMLPFTNCLKHNERKIRCSYGVDAKTRLTGLLACLLQVTINISQVNLDWSFGCR